MGMNYLDRGKTVTTKYYTDEDDAKVIELLKEWIPRRKEAIANETPLPKVPEFVGKAINDIVTKTSTRYNYSGYWFREDMIGDAIINIIRYLHTFDTELVGKKGKINFFSWVTMCLDRSFSKRISLEEEQKYLRLKSFSEMGGFSVLSEDEQVMIPDFINATGIEMDFQERIGTYEDKRERARAKERQKSQDLREAERLAKMPKGIARMLKITAQEVIRYDDTTYEEQDEDY